MSVLSDYELQKVSLDEKNVAFVMVPTHDGKEGSVGVYLPKLMTEIKMGDSVWEKPKTLSSRMISNDNFKVAFDPVIVHRNYYNVAPLRLSNVEAPAVKEGETVWVRFLDGDMKRGTYEPQFVDESKRKTDRHRIFVSSKSDSGKESGEYEILMDSSKQKIRIAMDGGRGEGKYSVEVDAARGVVLDAESSHVVVGHGDVVINGTSFNALLARLDKMEARLAKVEGMAHTH